MDISIVGAWGAIGRQIATSLIEGKIMPPSARLQLVGRRGGASEHDPLGDIIIFAAGETLPTDAQLEFSRSDLAAANLPVFEHYAKVIAENGHGEELVLVVTNPIELGVEIFCRYLPRNRVIGMGAYLDTLRFRREIAWDLGIRRQNVQGLVLGEHGGNMVPCWSTVQAFGFDSPEGRQRLQSLRGDSPITLPDALHKTRTTFLKKGVVEAYRAVSEFPPDVRTFAKPYITHLSGAKTPLGTAEMITRLLETILAGNQTLAAAQVKLEGEFLGIRGVTGVPVVLSHRGLERVEPIQLWAEEANAVQAAAEKAANDLREVTQ